MKGYLSWRQREKSLDINVSPMKKHAINRCNKRLILITLRGRCGRDHMVVEFTTTCAISSYHH